ncbi:MFS transporter [Halovulum dunhuangense]|uniref:MFS transporter n=1 Tax=Halovulum dunhuangense TaxID=1505036 RepID=A0A849L2X5_9RHOB|nr:MFS transporter [Halovulum dunhuangense]NNU80649.1 MFS transporter [Halovulum dunhuangense]
MLTVLRTSWPLLLGLLFLMVGNGLQGTLLGVRGAIEGYDAGTMSYVMSAYFLGFLAGSKLTPALIAQVGHVRVFAALASLISAAFILYAAIPHPVSWALMRFIVGLCFCGVYIVSESWLNGASTNETRGQALSLYMIVQMVGIIAAQGLLNIADPAEYTLFVIMSVLVSVAFAPILLSKTPAPAFEATKPMTLAQLFHISPLGMVGCFLLGGVFSGIFGMSAVYASEAGFSTAQTSLLVGLIYLGGLLFQYPVGWISDRMDRRKLIVGGTAIGAAASLLALPVLGDFTVVCIVGFIVGAMANPLYSLMIAYTNDFLEPGDMASASGGLLFANGLGAIMGPIVIGLLMARIGPVGFFVFLGTLFAAVMVYALYRMTQRPAPAVEDTTAYSPVFHQATPVALEVAQEVAQEKADEAAARA